MSDRTTDAPTVTDQDTQLCYQPRTSLGKLLWDIRREILASDQRLLDWDGVEQEVSGQREDSWLEK